MKIISSIKVGIVTLALLIVPAASAAASFGPPRPTLTWNQTAKDVTFNSVINNPVVGDERAFATVRNFKDNNYTDQLKVSDNADVVLRIYYHNDAAADKVAKNTKVQVNFPVYAAKSIEINSYISADNAKPGTVTDTAALTADQDFSIEYVKGSAQIWNNSLRGKTLSDAIITQQGGALVGYDKLDGKVPGGSKYSGYVTLKFKVHFKQAGTGARVSANGSIANTGPGEVLGLFAGATAIGTAAHMAINARRHRR
jgi:hypothetical protein